MGSSVAQCTHSHTILNQQSMQFGFSKAIPFIAFCCEHNNNNKKNQKRKTIRVSSVVVVSSVCCPLHFRARQLQMNNLLFNFVVQLNSWNWPTITTAATTATTRTFSAPLRNFQTALISILHLVLPFVCCWLCDLIDICSRSENRKQKLKHQKRKSSNANVPQKEE